MILLHTGSNSNMSETGIEDFEELKHRDFGIGDLSILLDSLKEKSTKTEQKKKKKTCVIEKITGIFILYKKKGPLFYT